MFRLVIYYESFTCLRNSHKAIILIEKNASHEFYTYNEKSKYNLMVFCIIANLRQGFHKIMLQMQRCMTRKKKVSRQGVRRKE